MHRLTHDFPILRCCRERFLCVNLSSRGPGNVQDFRSRILLTYRCGLEFASQCRADDRMIVLEQTCFSLFLMFLLGTMQRFSRWKYFDDTRISWSLQGIFLEVPHVATNLELRPPLQLAGGGTTASDSGTALTNSFGSPRSIMVHLFFFNDFNG